MARRSKLSQYRIVSPHDKKRRISREEFNRLSALYDRLYKDADLILKKHNPCNIVNGRCAEGLPCCHRCEFLTKKGCRVEALACKLHLCEDAKKKFPQCVKELGALRRQAKRWGFLRERGSKEDIFFDYEIVD